MTQDEIIRMAREAGFETIDGKLFLVGYDGEFSVELLERFAALVAAHEREECAKLCHSLEEFYPHTISTQHCAAAIIDRGRK